MPSTWMAELAVTFGAHSPGASGPGDARRASGRGGMERLASCTRRSAAFIAYRQPWVPRQVFTRQIARRWQTSVAAEIRLRREARCSRGFASTQTLVPCERSDVPPGSEDPGGFALGEDPVAGQTGELDIGQYRLAL